MNILRFIKNEKTQKKIRSKRIGSKRERKIDIPNKLIKTIANNLALILFFSTFGGLGIFSGPQVVYAEALPDLPLIFDSDITFADNVISFPAGAGTAITNTDVLSDIYTNFSGSGYGVADLAYMYDIVDSSGVSLGMTTEEIFSHLGNESYFTENSYDLKLKDYNAWKNKLDTSQNLSTYGAEFIHEATFHDSVNPWEWDWAEMIKAYLKRGAIPFAFDIAQKDLGTTITKTLYDVMESVIDYFANNIDTGTPINVKLSNVIQNALYSFQANSASSYLDRNKYLYVCKYNQEPVALGAYKNGNKLMVYGYFSESPIQLIRINYKFQNDSWYSPDYITLQNNSGYNTTDSGYYYDNTLYGIPFFNSQSACQQYVQGVVNGTIQKVSKNPSPDIINPNFSNLNGEELERMSPSIEQGQALRPIPEQSYDNFANTANGNTESGNAHNNAPLLENLLNPYIDSPIVPQPTSIPVPTGRPVSPEQPDYPEEPELTAEEIDESLEALTPDLTDIFPFCIPWDIAAIFGKFQAEREAPYFEFPIQSELFGIDETIVIDFSMFDDVAEILRYMELIVFIISLAVATRKLIGAL